MKVILTPLPSVNGNLPPADIFMLFMPLLME